MSDRPILFSGPMVRALIAGTKTQTRRVLKKPKWAEPSCDFEIEADGPYIVVAATGCTAKVPTRYAVGDRLWVRETWQGLSFGDYEPTESKVCDVRFAATDALGQASKAVRGYPWRPAIHMPRWASRLTLTVTDVRVERLQDISEEDALAEGVERLHHGFYPYGISTFMTVFVDGKEVPAQCCTSAHDSYMLLWDSINGRGAWDANPWVAAYTFTVEHGNIDQLARAE